MNDEHRNLLRRYHLLFQKDLEPRRLLAHLVTVLDARDEEEIKAQTTREFQVDKLMEILPRRGPQAFGFFLDALEVVQPFLAVPLREEEEIEKRFTETKTELGRARSHSANLRNQLSCATSQLETEKSRHGKTRKELDELKSIHHTLLSEVKRENQKLLVKVTETGVVNEALKQELRHEQELKAGFQSKVHNLETLLENKINEMAKFREKEFYMKGVKEKQSPSRKLSLEERKSHFRREILSRRAYSEKSSYEESMDNEPLERFDEIIQEESVYVHDRKTLEIIHNEREAMLNCFEEKLEEMNNELNLVKSEKESVQLECTQLRDKLSALEEETTLTSLQDRATSPLAKSSGTDDPQCTGCKTMSAKCEKLQLKIEREITFHKEEIRKMTCRTNELTDKFERDKKSLELEIVSLTKLYDTSKDEYKNLQNEMAEQHTKDINNQCVIKADLTAQIERDKQVITKLKSELDKERESNRTIQKDFDKLKKKTKAEKKQFKQQLDQESKVSTNKIKEGEVALKELRDIEKRNIEEIARLRKITSELQNKADHLGDELERWRSLPGRVFNFKKEFDRNGVIYTLGTNFYTTPFSNPASNNNCSIIVTRSSQGHGHPTDILELRKGTLSCTKDEENSWWRVDLGEDYTLFVTHYTLRHGRDNGLSVIRNWNLEGSRDGRNWKILRKHENDRTLREPFPYFTGTWTVEGKIEAMRFFRLRQTGKNSSGRYALCLSGFEIYGVLLFMKG